MIERVAGILVFGGIASLATGLGVLAVSVLIGLFKKP